MEKKKIFSGSDIVVVFKENPYPPTVLCTNYFEFINEIKDLSKVKRFPTIDRAKAHVYELLGDFTDFDYYKCEELNELLEEYNRRKLCE